MAETSTTQVSHPTKLLGRVVASVPAHYRQELTRVASRIRDSFPPVVIEHRLDALDRRLAEIEAKVDELLRRSGKP